MVTKRTGPSDFFKNNFLIIASRSKKIKRSQLWFMQQLCMKFKHISLKNLRNMAMIKKGKFRETNLFSDMRKILNLGNRARYDLI